MQKFVCKHSQVQTGVCRLTIIYFPEQHYHKLYTEVMATIIRIKVVHSHNNSYSITQKHFVIYDETPVSLRRSLDVLKSSSWGHCKFLPSILPFSFIVDWHHTRR